MSELDIILYGLGLVIASNGALYWQLFRINRELGTVSQRLTDHVNQEVVIRRKK